METKKELISPALAQEIAGLINRGGWAHASELGYPYPNGPVTAEVKYGLLVVNIHPKRRAGSHFMLHTDPDCDSFGHEAATVTVEIGSDPRPELLRLTCLTGSFSERRWHTYILIHQSNARFNVRRRRRQVSGRLKRRGIGCSWDQDGRLILAFADGTFLRVR